MSALANDVEICNSVNLKFAKISCFRGLMAPKPYVPHQNSLTKGISLGFWLDPEMKLCHLSCSLITNTLSKLPVLRTCKIPCTEIWKFFTDLRTCTPIHVFYFKSGQNRCRISGRRSALYWLQKNETRFGILRCNLWEDFPYIFVWVSTYTPHLYSRFHPDLFGFGGDITENSLHDPRVSL